MKEELLIHFLGHCSRATRKKNTVRFTGKITRVGNSLTKNSSVWSSWLTSEVCPSTYFASPPSFLIPWSEVHLHGEWVHQVSVVSWQAKHKTKWAAAPCPRVCSHLLGNDGERLRADRSVARNWACDHHQIPKHVYLYYVKSTEPTVIIFSWNTWLAGKAGVCLVHPKFWITKAQTNIFCTVSTRAAQISPLLGACRHRFSSWLQCCNSCSHILWGRAAGRMH